MSGRTWLTRAFPLVVLIGAGCTVPCHKGYQKALEHGAECGLPPTCRNRVHVFLMHGLTPSTCAGLEALRLRLGENGFAKVGSGELCHAGWVRGEVECIRRHDPDARFVLVGYDYGAATACSLARDLSAKGAGVDAVVLLNPKGCPPEPCGVYTLLVADPGYTGCVPHSARVVAPGAGHFTLPAHPTTVAAMTELLTSVAERHCEPEVEEVPVWTYPHAPEARRASPTAPAVGWDFLAERGPPRRIGETAAAPAPAPVAATRAAPVAANR